MTEQTKPIAIQVASRLSSGTPQTRTAGIDPDLYLVGLCRSHRPHTALVGDCRLIPLNNLVFRYAYPFSINAFLPVEFTLDAYRNLFAATSSGR